MKFIPSLAVAAALILSAAPLAAQPAAVNVASFANPNLPNGKIAQGSMFEIFGSGIADPGINTDPEFPLDTVLAGSSVSVTVGGTTVQCPMVRTLANDRVAALMPSDAPLGAGTFTVTYNGATSPPAPIEVVAHSPGIFTLNSAGSGPGIFTDAQSFAINTALSSFQPGAFVDVWMTGLGAVPFSDSIQPPLQDLAYDVKVFVGGQEIPVLFRGRSGCCAGLDIVRFQVPQNVEGCYVPVQVSVNGAPSNIATMAISSGGGLCSDGDGGFLDPGLLSIANDAGSASIAQVTLSRLSISADGLPGVGQTFIIDNDSASANFERYTRDQIIRLRGIFNQTTVGSCSAFQFTGDEVNEEDPSALNAQGIPAGTITISGNGRNETLDQVSPGNYFKSFFQIPGLPGGIPLPIQAIKDMRKGQFGGGGFFGPGTYTATGSGSESVGSFSTQITIPQRPTNNMDSIPFVDRSRSLNITYTPTPSADYVQITGFSITDIDAVEPSGAFFFCRANAATGSFTVPQPILALMPVSEVSEGVPAGGLSVGIGSLNEFSVSGIDKAFSGYLDMQQTLKEYR